MWRLLKQQLNKNWWLHEFIMSWLFVLVPTNNMIIEIQNNGVHIIPVTHNSAETEIVVDRASRWTKSLTLYISGCNMVAFVMTRESRISHKPNISMQRLQIIFLEARKSLGC